MHTTSPAPVLPSLPRVAAHLTPAQVEAFGRELDAIRARVAADLGERDARYIRALLAVQMRAELAGRALLYLPVVPPLWLGGVALLSLAKILENMEIGHNVMHGQYDFLQDPALDGRTYEWDNACPARQWRHSHNHVHHAYTNVVGQDRDVGYGVLRVAEEQPWHLGCLAQPLVALGLALLFQWGVALHDVEIDRVVRGEKPLAQAGVELTEVWRKGRRQLLKDYVLFPALSGPFFLTTVLGNGAANLARNVWAFTVIFCGHFPDGAATFTASEVKDETRGRWYLRQLLGSANFEGSPLLHLLSGNLSHQIEHHLFPDLPAHRYAEIAVQVRAVCTRYGLPYNTGTLAAQFGTVVRKILRYALPPLPRWSSAPAAA
ncbi:MAG: acyl-CoA desaturase [Candidatus Binatia bacterium]